MVVLVAVVGGGGGVLVPNEGGDLWLGNRATTLLTYLYEFKTKVFKKMEGDFLGLE